MGWPGSVYFYAEFESRPKKLLVGAASSARKGTPPPGELALFWMCQRYGSLPDPGGLLDQDAGRMARMGTLSNLYDDVAALSKKKHKELHKLDKYERWLLAWLMEEGLW